MANKRIDDHTLKVLEFDAVRQILGAFAASDLGKKAADVLYPSIDGEWIKTRLAETSELKVLLERGGRVPLVGLSDIGEIIEHIGEKQTVLEPIDLLKISDTLNCSGRVKKYFSEQDEGQAPALRAMADELVDYQEIVDQVNRCIDGNETVKDEASEKLKGVRRQIGQLGSTIQQKFRSIISAPQIRKAIANDNFLTRNGRVVILVKENYRRYVKGMVLDRSNTGSTLYIEPYELAELSNELEDVLFEEKKEIEKILWQLTKMILDRRKEILATVRQLSLVDLTYAKARFSMAYKKAAPTVRPGGTLKVRQARHPLLVHLVGEQKGCAVSEIMDEIIPIDVRLGSDFDLLLITGPNTGGKTVTLKTIGLLALMAQSGMHVLAWPGSQLPVYRQVFADIGDEQSIEQSLSTFSAHIRQIVGILNRANDKSLVLMDELGSGTDPTEGAALGTAILGKLGMVKAHVVATTHLGRLKNFAYTTSRVENASVQFDVETLKPTYQLMIGTPGSSNALAIVKRLGMDKSIVAKARSLLGSEADSSSELINQVQLTRQQSEEVREEAQKRLDAAEGMAILAAEKLERIEEQRNDLEGRADKVVDKSMRQVRRVVRRFVAGMQNAPKEWRGRAEELGSQIETVAGSMPLAQRQAKFAESVRKGDSVYVVPMKCQGMVMRINRKRRVMSLLMSDGKEVEVPFTEVVEVER